MLLDTKAKEKPCRKWDIFTITFEQFYSQSLQEFIARKFLSVLSKINIGPLQLVRHYDDTYKTKIT